MINTITEALANLLLLASPFLVGIAWDMGVSAAEDLERFLKGEVKQNERNRNCKRL